MCEGVSILIVKRFYACSILLKILKILFSSPNILLDSMHILEVRIYPTETAWKEHRFFATSKPILTSRVCQSDKHGLLHMPHAHQPALSYTASQSSRQNTQSAVTQWTCHVAGRRSRCCKVYTQKSHRLTPSCMRHWPTPAFTHKHRPHPAVL